MMELKENYLRLKGKDLTIKTDVESYGQVINAITLQFKDSSGNSFEINMSFRQANAIQEILTHYVTAYYAYAAVTSEKKVKT